MAATADLLAQYLYLAQASGRAHRAFIRDKLLVLAAAEAAGQGLPHVAAGCRGKVLANNPGHALARYATVEEAVADDDFQFLLKQLRRHYSGERVEHLLAKLGLDLARERALYQSDEEYVGALLNAVPEALPSGMAAPRWAGEGSDDPGGSDPKASGDAAGDRGENPYAPPQSKDAMGGKPRIAFVPLLLLLLYWIGLFVALLVLLGLLL